MEVAAYWAMRLTSDECTPADRAAFEKWRREDPAHETAYSRVDTAMGGVYRNIDNPELMAYAAEVSTTADAERSFTWKRVAGGAIAACLALVVALSVQFSSFGGRQLGSSEIVYQTKIGERSTTFLADGSEIILNTDTKLTVDYSDHERRLVLARGQAFFKVAKDAARPFVVVAGDNRIVATGTEFDVRFDVGKRVSVTLVEGEVIVDGAALHADAKVDGAARTPIIMTPGQQVVASVNAAPALVKVDVERVVSWSEGRLVFENDPLANAVAGNESLL